MIENIAVPAPAVNAELEVLEVEREVKTFHVERICSLCRTGKMIPDPFNVTMELWRTNNFGGEPKFPHTCNNNVCGAKDIYTDRYPKLICRYIDEVKE